MPGHEIYLCDKNTTGGGISRYASTYLTIYIILPSSSLSSKNPPSRLTARSMALNSTEAFRGLSRRSSKSIRAERVLNECWFLIIKA